MLPEKQYHVFNHANGHENIFIEQENYYFFPKKMGEHIFPVCRVYAYCLMPNHFHLLVETRTEEELNVLWKKPNQDVVLPAEKLSFKISKAFANFFSSYTQSFNKIYNRKGSLFIPGMKTTLVDNDHSFCKVVHYIHANPVHHGFSDTIEGWANSSYNTIMSSLYTRIERQYVLVMFGGAGAFIRYHQQPIEIKINHFD